MGPDRKPGSPHMQCGHSGVGRPVLQEDRHPYKSGTSDADTHRGRRCDDTGQDIDKPRGRLGRILPHGSREAPALATLTLDFWPLDPGGDPFLSVKSLVWQPDGDEKPLARS